MPLPTPACLLANNIMRRHLTFALLVFVFVALFGMLVWHFGAASGRADATAVKERLNLIFPDVMAMPELDRAFLASLSMHCRLSQRRPDREETIRCLRDAAKSPSTLLPKGITDGPAHLDVLLQRVPKAIEAPSQTRA